MTLPRPTDGVWVIPADYPECVRLLREAGAADVLGRHGTVAGRWCSSCGRDVVDRVCDYCAELERPMYWAGTVSDNMASATDGAVVWYGPDGEAAWATQEEWAAAMAAARSDPYREHCAALTARMGLLPPAVRAESLLMLGQPPEPPAPPDEELGGAWATPGWEEP